MQFDIRLITRNDFLDNWEASGSIIKRGELAIAFDLLGNPVELKIGEDKTWNNTDTGLVPFKPIVTTAGRNLDNPGGVRNINWNLTTLNDALLEIFAPYVFPSVSLSPSGFANQEVGTTFIVNDQLFTASILNANNILVEGNKKFYVNGSANSLTNQTATTVTESITIDINANRTTSGNVAVLTVFVKNNKNSGQQTAVVNVPFKLRSGYFLWKNNDPLFAKSDAEISAIIQSVQGGITGVRSSTIDTDGAKVNAVVNFNTGSIPNGDVSSVDGNGFYDIYIYNPVASGTPYIFNTPAGSGNPQDKESQDFNYLKGNASTPYRLTKTLTTGRIVGTYSLTIQ